MSYGTIVVISHHVISYTVYHIPYAILHIIPYHIRLYRIITFCHVMSLRRDHCTHDTMKKPYHIEACISAYGAYVLLEQRCTRWRPDLQWCVCLDLRGLGSYRKEMNRTNSTPTWLSEPASETACPLLWQSVVVGNRIVYRWLVSCTTPIPPHKVLGGL